MNKIITSLVALISLNVFAKEVEFFVQQGSSCNIAKFPNYGADITAPPLRAQRVMREFAKKNELQNVLIYSNQEDLQFKKTFHVFYTGLNTFNPRAPERSWSVGVEESDVLNPDIPAYYLCVKNIFRE